jgi:hypothetical protein
VYEYGSNVTFKMPDYTYDGYTAWAEKVKFLGMWCNNKEFETFDHYSYTPYARTEYIEYGPCCELFWYEIPVAYCETKYKNIYTANPNCGGTWIKKYESDYAYVFLPGFTTVCPEHCKPQIVDWKYYQRFVIENYSEPCFVDPVPYTYSAWGSFDLFKGNAASPATPVPGAQYLLSYISGQTYEPDTTEWLLTIGADGHSTPVLDELPWGTYELIETLAPAGFSIDPTVYTYKISGNALYEPNDGLTVEANVTNAPIPGGGTTTITTTTTTPAAPILAVAGIATPGIIQVLAFTGADPAIPIAGIGAITGGLGLFIASLIRKRKK